MLASRLGLIPRKGSADADRHRFTRPMGQLPTAQWPALPGFVVLTCLLSTRLVVRIHPRGRNPVGSSTVERENSTAADRGTLGSQFRFAIL